MNSVEPWLRGVLPDVDAAIGHLIRSAEQIREDCATALAGTTRERVWTTRAGFHAKHLAGSTLRLCAYLEQRELTPDEVAAASREGSGEESPEELLAAIEGALGRYTELLGSLKPAEFASLRFVGTKKIAVSAIGLAIHIAEHGQRHTGQLIEALKA